LKNSTFEKGGAKFNYTFEKGGAKFNKLKHFLTGLALAFLKVA